MLNLDPDLDGSGLTFEGTRAPAPILIAAPLPLDFATFFRCSFFSTNFSQMVPQSEYSSDLGAQKAPFRLPLWSPFWVWLQKLKLSSRVDGNPPEALRADPQIDKKTGLVLKALLDRLF